ncbi:MAG: class I SAM-dependent methyltransferase [Acidiferrobacter sp.]
MSDTFADALVDLAAAPYRRAGRFAWRFARGKLMYDPIFVALLARGLIPDGSHIVDLGCGQGLLSSWLTAARDSWTRITWPPSWPEPPQIASYHGIEWMARDVDRARCAVSTATFTWGDMRTIPFGPANIVTIFDVLHYVDHTSQDGVLERVRATLAPGGLLLLRVGDAAAGWPFHISRWVDFVVTSIRGGRWQRLYCRSQQAWLARLAELGFKVTALPMSQRTPFANVLLVARLGPAASP